MPTFLRTLLLTADRESLARELPRHEAHLEEWRREGRLVMEFVTRNRETHYELFQADDRLDADRLARLSPLVELGLCSWTVREVEASGDSGFSPASEA